MLRQLVDCAIQLSTLIRNYGDVFRL